VKNVHFGVIIAFLFLPLTAAPCLAERLPETNPTALNDQEDLFPDSGDRNSDQPPPDEMQDEELEYLEEDGELEGIADPLEPLNRLVFHFNDKLYFWIVKPLAKGYAAVVPEGVRLSVRNVFNNISTPVRVVNNLLQLKIRPAGNELLRFGINSTAGMLGLYDVARTEMGIRGNDEDFGQTLGVWGLGPVIFINWPFLGPSTLRDSVGYGGDYFLDPLNYVKPYLDSIAIQTGEGINRTSLSIGDYEDLKKDALDPYTAVRDIYSQYRKSRIER